VRSEVALFLGMRLAEEVVRSMQGWLHSGFGIYASVQIEADEKEGMRLVSFISRCPFSLARMNGKFINFRTRFH